MKSSSGSSLANYARVLADKSENVPSCFASEGCQDAWRREPDSRAQAPIWVNSAENLVRSGPSSERFLDGAGGPDPTGGRVVEQVATAPPSVVSGASGSGSPPAMILPVQFGRGPVGGTKVTAPLPAPRSGAIVDHAQRLRERRGRRRPSPARLGVAPSGDVRRGGRPCLQPRLPPSAHRTTGRLLGGSARWTDHLLG